MPYWLKAIIFYASALILLRVAGKRAISQMTPIEVVVMIALGTLLVHPLKSTDVMTSIYGGVLLVCGLLLLSLLQFYFCRIKHWITGEPIMLIENGKMNPENLKRARMTPDEIFMRLRIKQINDITKVKAGTLEISGELGVELFPEKSFATKQDIDEIKQALNLIGNKLNAYPFFTEDSANPENNIFTPVKEAQEKDPLN